MNRITPFLLATLVAASTFAGRLPLSETLVELRPDYRPAWTSWKLQPWTVGEDSLVITAMTNRDTSVSTTQMMRGTRTYFPDYCPSGRFKVTFEYKTDAEKGAGCGANVTPMQAYKNLPSFNKGLPKAADWTPFEATFELATYEPYEGGFRFSLPKGTNTLEVRRFRLVELPPAENAHSCAFKGNGQECPFSVPKPLVINGQEMTEIALLAADDEMTVRNERRAAMMIRYALVKAGYKYLPIVEYSRRTDTLVRSNGKETSSKTNGQECPFSGANGQECPFSGANGQECPFSDVAGRILVGRAAEGLFTDAQLEQIRTKDGTGAYAVKGGAAGVTGNNPGGPQYGAFRFLNAIGIEYLATDLFHVEPCTLGETAVVHSPSIPYRGTCPRSGCHAELLGLTCQTDLIGNLAVGSGDAGGCPWGLSHDSLGFIVSMREFDKTHPEYFALQADGTRMDAKRFHLGHCQFCWSNPELIKLVTARYIDIMRGNPGTKLFCFAPGDGGDWACRCENCKKLGTTSTGLVNLLNAVGRETGKVFPDKVIYTYSYATTLDAPDVKTVDPHVKFTDSIYCVSHWPNSLRYEHPANAKGLEALAAWRKLVPDMGVMLYYQFCGNCNELWPAFWGWVDAERDFARHGGYFLDRTYSFRAHACGYLPAPTVCGDASYYVLPRLDTDADYDVEAGLKRWFGLYYGSAAADMRAYFDRCHREVVDRDWVQNTEVERRGLATPAFTDECLAILDHAEKAIQGQGEDALATKAGAKQCGQGEDALATKAGAKQCGQGEDALATNAGAKQCGQGEDALATKAGAKQCGQGVLALAERERILAQIRQERGRLLYNYVRDNCRGRGNLSAAEFPKWAKRVAEWLKLAKTTAGLNYYGWRDVRKEFKKYFFYDLKRTHWNWAVEPQIDAIIADPEKELNASFPAKQEKTEKGWRIPVDGMAGGEGGAHETGWCVPKGEPKIPARNLRREITGNGLILAQLKLDTAPTKDVTLRIRGNDNDKPLKACLQIEINGQKVFSGPVTYPKDRWADATYAIPAAAFKAGINDVVLRNVTPETGDTVECGAAFQPTPDPYWGWIYLSHLDFEF